LLHEEVKVTKSRIINDIIAKSDKKPAADALEAMYRIHPDHIKAKEKYIQAMYDLNLAEIATKGMYQRRDMLENQIKLLGMNYYSKVSTSNGIKKIEVRMNVVSTPAESQKDNTAPIINATVETEPIKTGRVRRPR
jgi:hypothetical protein